MTCSSNPSGNWVTYKSIPLSHVSKTTRISINESARHKFWSFSHIYKSQIHLPKEKYWENPSFCCHNLKTFLRDHYPKLQLFLRRKSSLEFLLILAISQHAKTFWNFRHLTHKIKKEENRESQLTLFTILPSGAAAPLWRPTPELQTRPPFLIFGRAMLIISFSFLLFRFVFLSLFFVLLLVLFL